MPTSGGLGTVILGGWLLAQLPAVFLAAGVQNTGPPELPGLIAASVWIRCSIGGLPGPPSSVRSSAETMPVVTVPDSPSGEPMAATAWPSFRLADVPSAIEALSTSGVFTPMRLAVSITAFSLTLHVRHQSAVK